MEEDLIRLNTEIFGTKYIIKKIDGVNWGWKWCFMLPPESGWTDAAFSVVLLRDKRMEFKVPRSQWDEYWEDQQKIRRKLVRLYGGAKSKKQRP